MGHTSLMHGWLPLTVQTAAATVLLVALGWRTRRWRRRVLPVAALVGLAAAGGVYGYLAVAGLAEDPAPAGLWVWIALTGLAAVAAVTGWRGARWWRRVLALLAVPLCLLGALLALNRWVGYFPTVQTAVNQLTSGPLPGQTDRATAEAMAATGTVPRTGVVVPVQIPATASGFKHRGELVYLPPAWFTSPRPALPVVMMIGGEFNTPADWLRAGDAVATLDGFVAAHDGNAPVLVFVDSGGSFNTDTECVNGPRGNAADHLTDDVLPFLVEEFAVSADRAHWGVAGWSMGGTCALNLTVMHPDRFSAFVDIAGDRGPNSGTREQTIDRLFGGDADAWADFDPATVIARHGRYRDVAGWFTVPGGNADQTRAAEDLCTLGRAHGIDCAVVVQPGHHDWPYAAQAFRTALPWLAGRLGTPGVARIPLPPWRTR
ncbi:alpha/beta hydrolase-fold protein [Mycobacterium sp. 1274756.6]|uniref:alpha/beta hydrolase n=1 Tax=Mycobacterium sp. 1274756.6 TaxID=1834076 RepID=UPI000AE11F19|nr:alpha/beta hydrolase-fold protein [Mycobacterium sp. 1274756.6]